MEAIPVRPGRRWFDRNVKIVLTGSSGRVGRAVFGALAAEHEVVGIDRSPFSTTRHVADLGDVQVLRAAMAGADAVVHTAALHAPHVGKVADREFQRINVEGTATLLAVARQAGVARIVFTSTTALYGDAVIAGACTWIDEHSRPVPQTIYHRTKLDAEALLEAAASPGFAVRVLRMSRCFPEAPEVMALYRLHRGVDVRDVADAHVAALRDGGGNFQRYIVSGATPFRREDCAELPRAPREVIARRCPWLLQELDRRGWPLATVVDRIYDAGAAQRGLQWSPRHGPEEVFRQYDRRSIEVLPRGSRVVDRTLE
jgi:UDP-glucose 4-epimerase